VIKKIRFDFTSFDDDSMPVYGFEHDRERILVLDRERCSGETTKSEIIKIRMFFELDGKVQVTLSIASKTNHVINITCP
jgi:hypothetical protein